MIKVEEFLAKRLRKAGVTRCFGIPGGPSIPYMEAFRKEGIEFILTSHESSAAVMADVTARLTGITGVCHATFGPGATNLATGVGGALLDRSPLLALTSEMPDEWLGRTAQMNIDHQALFRPLTKATYRLAAPDAAEIINRGLEIANEEYPGPVHLGLPSDLAGKAVSENAAGFTGQYDKTGSGTNEKIRELLESSRRPLIAAGLTAMRHGIGDKLLKFLEQCNVPVVLTPMAKGLLTFSHPCYAGVLFHALSDRLERLIREADLVIGLGYDPVEYNYESWMPDVPLVHFDTRHSDTGIKNTSECISSPARWFELLSCLKGSPEMTALAAEVKGDIMHALQSITKPFNPVDVINTLKELLPADAVITADVGSHLHLLGQMWDVPPDGSLIITNGWSSMGFGLSAAIAAAMAVPDRQVVCITGDGGFLMHEGEIMTARRYGLKLIVVILSDSELNLIRIKQSGKNTMPYGTHIGNDRLLGSDPFPGIITMHASNCTEMHSAVKRALRAQSTVIIEATVDPAVYSDLVVRR